MSDISIPGVTASKYKTDELIQGLMRVERIPRDRAETELEGFRTQQDAWRNLNRHASNLREVSRNLYSFDNPFSEKIASSTDERAVTATARRDARFESFRVDVQQIAKGDSFLSAELPRDKTVPAGTYTFRVGEKSISMNWRGGTFRDFSDTLNRRSDGILQSRIINTTSRTQAMLIESQKTGSAERLSFEDAALTFGLDAGFIKKNDTSPVTPARTELTAEPRSTVDSQFSSTVRARDGYVLSFSVRVEKQEPKETGNDNAAIDTSSGSIMYQGIFVENIPSETALPPGAPRIPESSTPDLSVLSLRSARGVSIPLPALQDSPEAVQMEIPLSEFGDVTALLVSNTTADRVIEIDDIRVYDPKAQGDYIPVNPVSVAQDAIVKYEGITVRRSVNDIDDLVPGVTLTVREPTDRTATIAIEPDTELAKEAIISFVARYNRLMAEINILSQDKPEVISEIQYFTDEERTQAEKKLGLFQGDSTLLTIKNNLQRILSNSHPNRETDPLVLLSQMGISTNASTAGGFEVSRLRGYLEINEKQLDEALARRMPAVKDLFGFDSDGDMVIDTGVAMKIDQQIMPYVQIGGIFALRTSGLDTRIDSTERRIAQLDIQLKDKEADLRRRYGQMEGALNSLQNQSSAIQNFSNQNNNRR